MGFLKYRRVLNWSSYLEDSHLGTWGSHYLSREGKIALNDYVSSLAVF